MTQIIGLCGVIGSGKNYQQDLLVEKGFVNLDFKDALIDMCEDLVGFPIRGDYELFKECIIGVYDPDIMPQVLDGTKSHPRGISIGAKKHYPRIMTGRRLLQRLGTEVVRKRDPNYWVNAWYKKCTEYVLSGKSVVSADVRFKNEVETILLAGNTMEVPTKILFNDYHSDRYDTHSKHESEALAQKLLAMGLKDGDEITLDLIKSLK